MKSHFETRTLPSVFLIHSTPWEVAYRAIDKCYETTNRVRKQPAVDEMVTRINKVGLQLKHSSVLEHIVFSFELCNYSRATLQELSRHRLASPTVKSSRYTLKELAKETPFYVRGVNGAITVDLDRASLYVRITGHDSVDKATVTALEALRVLVLEGVPNDYAKFALPEAYLTTSVLTINARSLRNLLQLRLHKSAMWEIMDLAEAIYKAVPSDYRFLVQDLVLPEEDTNDN